jgi:hypothetical protein
VNKALDDVRSLCVDLRTTGAAASLAQEAAQDARTYLEHAGFKVAEQGCDARLVIDLSAKLISQHYSSGDGVAKAGVYATGVEGSGTIQLHLGSQPVYTSHLGLTHAPPPSITVGANQEPSAAFPHGNALASSAFNTSALAEMLFDLWGAGPVMSVKKSYLRENPYRGPSFWSTPNDEMLEIVKSPCTAARPVSSEKVAEPTVVSLTGAVARIAAGPGHSLVLKSDGTLWMTGNKDRRTFFPRCSEGGRHHSAKWIQVLSDVVDMGPYWAQKSDGKYWATYVSGGLVADWPDWFPVRKARLAFPETLLEASVSDEVFPGPEAKLFAIGHKGELWAVGENQHGELGTGNRLTRTRWAEVLSNVVAVSANGEHLQSHHSLAIREGGHLWATGANRDGQLGTGNHIGTESWTEVLSEVTAVAAGLDHSLAIRTDGSLWATGSNAAGQLGTGDEVRKFTWMRVLSEVTAVAAGNDYSLAIRKDQSLWGTGANTCGQLGAGDLQNRNRWVRLSQ